MAGEKTEKATPKKKRDAAKKGQSYKSKDLVALSVILTGVGTLYMFSFEPIMAMYTGFIQHGFKGAPEEVAKEIAHVLFVMLTPLLVACAVVCVALSWLQSGIALAPEILKIDFSGLDPIKGLKKIFSLKMLKEFGKAILYLLAFACAAFWFWFQYGQAVLAMVHVETASAATSWMRLGLVLLGLCLLCSIPIISMDAWLDYLLHAKELKMDKNEVKQERKQAEVSSEVKGRQKELHKELLSAQVKQDISESKFMLANPTHIAIGLYVDAQFPLPFVSVLEQGAKARAAIAYAERLGVPVLRDKWLARGIFKTVQRYQFVSIEWLEPLLNILVWLQEVEQSRNEGQLDVTAAEQEEKALEHPSPPNEG